MSKLAITALSLAILSASGLAHAGGHEDPQAQIEKLQQEKKILSSRLNRAIAFSKANRQKLAAAEEQKTKSTAERQHLLQRIARAKAYSKENLANQLAAQKKESGGERQKLLRRIARAKAYSKENLANELAAQKKESGGERQKLLRRIARAKAYSKENLANQLAAQKQASVLERRTLLRRIDRVKAHAKAKGNSTGGTQTDWAANTGAALNAAFGGAQGTAVTRNADETVTIQVGNNGLFNSGGATLSGNGSALLATIAQELAVTNANITVVGHTDNIPVGSNNPFATNEALSFARALSTLEFLRDQGVATERLSAAGYGAASPIASNDTAEGRAQNRRVDIVLRK